MDPQEPLCCIIKLGIDVGAYHCSGTSLEELKYQALVEHRKCIGSNEWDNADLVCLKDGDEIGDMGALADHLKKCHGVFCMIHPKLESYVRALNIDGAARLYRKLTDLSGMFAVQRGSVKAVRKHIKKNIMQWADDRRKRRKDLQVIDDAHHVKLAAKLKVHPKKVSNMKGRIRDALDDTEESDFGSSCGESDSENTKDLSD